MTRLRGSRHARMGRLYGFAAKRICITMRQDRALNERCPQIYVRFSCLASSRAAMTKKMDLSGVWLTDTNLWPALKPPKSQP